MTEVDYAARLRNMLAEDPVHKDFERGHNRWGDYAIEQSEIQQRERDARHAQGIYTPEPETPTPPRQTVPAYLPSSRGPPPGQWSRGPPRYSRRRGPSRSPPRYSRRRSPSRYSRRRSPSRSPSRYSPPRRSPSVNSFGRRLSYSPPRQSRRAVSRRPRRNGSVNSFGRNMSYVPPRAARRPRFFNNATGTYRVRPRFFNNASGQYLTPPSPV